MRTCKVFRNNKWEDCKFKDILKGDMFKLFDDGIEVLGADLKSTFLALSDAYMNYDGDYTIDIKETE